ncbi:hypothetical protein [Spirosoma utsteinense]|uniref:Uncharacterized protein n=1 Tax=Spirosoma utsteinense TaxID=2585773 RepID=A0ABR6WFU1_9BACT|nr:hypothetical protein [Spirosoma utsteinense]MBC3795420.1 hypothetical protein [Spirosoma utsteinense]
MKMFIGFIAPIAINDLLSIEQLKSFSNYPKGHEGAPFVSILIQKYIADGHKVLAITTDKEMDDNSPAFIYENDKLTLVVIPCRKRSFSFNGRRVGRALDLFRFERKAILSYLEKYKPEVLY